MAHYLVRAKPQRDQLAALRARLDSGEIGSMRPFGQALNYSLLNARIIPDDWVVWEEEDYCHPPLAMERAAVLEEYFTDLSVEPDEREAGWDEIEHLPPLWQE